MEKCRSSTQVATCTGSERRAKYRATDMTRELRGLPAVFWPNWQAVNRKTCPEMERPDMSLSHPPKHVSGLKPTM